MCVRNSESVCDGERDRSKKGMRAKIHLGFISWGVWDTYTEWVCVCDSVCLCERKKDLKKNKSEDTNDKNSKAAEDQFSILNYIFNSGFS